MSLTEDDIRRIVREEIESAKPMEYYRGIPFPPNAPVVQTDWRWPGGVPGATSFSACARPDPAVMIWNAS